VICLDGGGPSLQVTDQCGFKAPVSSLEEALDSMADAMTVLYRNPDLGLRSGTAARKRARTDFHRDRLPLGAQSRTDELALRGGY